MKNLSLIKQSKLLFATAAICTLIPVTIFGAPTVLDSAISPVNGHTYLLLSNSDWTDAENEAVALGGHLATVRSLDENNWILNRFGTNRDLWIGLHDPITGDGSGTQHATNFVWSSGETATYRNWHVGEPNGDDYVCMFYKGSAPAGLWNDNVNDTQNESEPPLYGVVELNVCTPHHATATAILYNNFVVGATITDTGCGYTNAPQVLIQGGGGSGATATASVTNGGVTAINITTTGSGYTNAPQIIIASPSFIPTVAINVSAVKVTQHVMLGMDYILQSSPDLVNWTAVGPAFTATNEYMVNEFELNGTNQFYRIQQAP